jgi:hypothetical protein
MKRDGVYNPVTHAWKALEASKGFSRGCKPRPTQDSKGSVFLPLLLSHITKEKNEFKVQNQSVQF